MFNPKTMFRGPGGPQLAAVLIQKHFKGWRAYSNFKQLKYLMIKASVIQKRYRLWRLKSQTNKKLTELKKDQLKVWQKMQQDFIDQWAETRHQHRVEIHVNSFTIDEW